APFDGYFDTVTVGDMGGNLWVGRMHRPGEFGPDGTVQNWYVARAFQTERDAASGTLRRPITYLTSNALQRTTGYMRTFFGTGDRSSLPDKTTGTCSLANLSACVAMGCTVQTDEWRDALPSTQYRRTHWAAGLPDEVPSSDDVPCVASMCVQDKIAQCINQCDATSCSGSFSFTPGGGRA